MIVWTTEYLAAAAEDLTQQGCPVPDALWPHLTPLQWEHVNLVGQYTFEEPVITGRLRPLRHLDDAFREAIDERICHLFTIVGAAGVGKSRVVEEFIGSLGEEAQVATGR